KVCDLTGTPTAMTENPHYILISHGPSGAGTYTAEGRATASCPVGEARDAENCDYQNNARFLFQRCAANNNAGANFYDDYIAYETRFPTRIWAVNAENENDIFTN